MAPREFCLPLHLEDLELKKSKRYYVHQVIQVDTLSEDEWVGTLAQMERDFAALAPTWSSSRPHRHGHLPLQPQQQEEEEEEEKRDEDDLVEKHLDFVYSACKRFHSLSDAFQVQLVKTMTHVVMQWIKTTFGGVSNQKSKFTARQTSQRCENSVDTRNVVKFLVLMLATLLSNAVRIDHAASRQSKHTAGMVRKTATKSKSSGPSATAVWCTIVEKAVEALHQTMRPEVFALWNMNVPEEEFLLVVCRTVCAVMERPMFLRSKTIKPKLFKLVGSCVSKIERGCSVSVVALLVDIVCNHEHGGEMVAEMLKLLQQESGGASDLTQSLVSEIAKTSTTISSKDSASGRNIMSFFVAMSSLVPDFAQANLQVILPLFQAESYPLRNAAATCLTHIIISHSRARASAGGDERQDRPNPSDDGECEESASDDTRKPKLREVSTSTRDQALEILQERLFDGNSFARSHVLRMWHMICEKNALPVAKLVDLVNHTTDRLNDKAVIVRKASINLLALLLESNPFMGHLDCEFYKEKLQQTMQTLQQSRKTLIDGAEHEMSSAMDELSVDSKEAAMAHTSRRWDEEQDAQEHDPTTAETKEKEFHAAERLCEFYGAALGFIHALESRVIPAMAKLLGSKTSSDVIESMHFFRRAFQFHLKGADGGFKKMLQLIWRADVSIQNEMLKIFAATFFGVDGDMDSNEEYSIDKIAENLIQLIDECTTSEFNSIERILRELSKRDELPSGFQLALWEFVNGSLPPSVVANALYLLKMSIAEDSSTVFSNEKLLLLLSSGFGEFAMQDESLQVFRAACCLLKCFPIEKATHKAQRRSRKERRRSSLTNHKANLELIEEMVKRIARFITLQYVSGEKLQARWCTWVDTVQLALEVIVQICDKPEEVIADVIKELSSRVFMDPSRAGGCDALEVAHFVFVLGHTGLLMTVEIERIANVLKKLRSTHDHHSSTDQASGKSRSEEEMEEAVEIEAEEEGFVHDLIQKEIVCKNLLGSYGTLVAEAIHEENVVVKESAVVALSKFMAISSEFCERYLQILFTTLKASEQPSVRANIVVALGDLCFRHPNLVEPWTSHVYTRLKDVDAGVRMNTLVVLSHLILNDMIKVKSQISEIAFLLLDPDDEIRDFTRVFFHELSLHGNNPIYNFLPDITSRLSRSELVSCSEFQEIAKFLFGFVVKDKQVESIVDKFCQRFPKSSPSEQADLSYCLSLLPTTEKSVRLLIQHKKLFKTALVNDDVLENFQRIMSKMKKTHSISTTATEEFQELLRHVCNNDKENSQDDANDSTDVDKEKPGAVADTGTASPPKPRSVKKKKKSSAQTAKVTKHVRTRKVPLRRTRSTRTQLAHSCSSSEEE